MHVLWHSSQMKRIAPVCSTFLWICDAAERRQSAISRLLRGSGDLAERLFAEKCSESFVHSWANPSNSLWMQAHANVLPPQRFSQVKFSLARGLGETAVRYTGPTKGQGCKTCPERAMWWSRIHRNTLQSCCRGIWWKTFDIREIKSDLNNICEVWSVWSGLRQFNTQVEDWRCGTKPSFYCICVVFYCKHSAQQATSQHNDFYPISCFAFF